MQKETCRLNHRPRENEVSAGERGVLRCDVEEMKSHLAAQKHAIRPAYATGLDVFFQKMVVSMRLLLVSEDERRS